ncbi:GNAT family N-acetyltransferase [Aurantimonas sp. MSK8Z-1]|uniref:GNAT family N-acetyltransferase n=1 Tax=Mangrovibrevibacter kandeliae TaxID=2968473 RepID=UPI002118EFA4|nr:GNAT family N-acetyltransferase [Aurantimonas sp. MSK8Z-1]MCW4115672.1 GNAT family N-acetyltransferase [Aurantimonas sp. MSK8Z-1]
MFVRLALDTDVEDIVRMGRANVFETKTLDRDAFDEARLREVIQGYFDGANPTIFVVEHRRQVIAFLFATMNRYDYRAGLFTAQRVLYVSPENRGTRAAVLLIKELVRWSERLGAVEIKGGNDNGFQSERTADFLTHFGFERVGLSLTKRLDGGGAHG